MGILCSEIKDYLDSKAPLNLAEDWDNVGLLIGSTKREVNAILVCLDVTEEVVQEALKKRVDLIVSHHPLIFKGMKKINEDEPYGQILYTLIRNNISVYCAHTNLDVADGGVNDQLAKRIGLKNLKNLNYYKSEKLLNTNDNDSVELKDKIYSMGKVGELEKPIFLNDFIAMVKAQLGVEYIRLIGNIKSEINRVAVFCGSFDESYAGSFSSKADILITGDIKYHTAIELQQKGLCVIDAGHFHTEKWIIPSLSNLLKSNFPSIEVFESKMAIDPFKIT